MLTKETLRDAALIIHCLAEFRDEWDSPLAKKCPEPVRAAMLDLTDVIEESNAGDPEVLALTNKKTIIMGWERDGRELIVEVLGPHGMRWDMVHSNGTTAEGGMSASELPKALGGMLKWLETGEEN